MAGAEGERGFDLDADAVDRNAGAVVRAVHDKAAGRDRLQPGKAFATQSAAAMRLEAQRACRRGAAGHCRQRAHACLRRPARPKIQRHAPVARPGIQADGDIIAKTLGDQIGKLPRRLFTGFEASRLWCPALAAGRWKALMG